MAFEQAVRAGSPLIVGIVSETGAGKTHSALRLARGLVGPEGRIGVLDTESGRAKHYTDLTPFGWEPLTAPFSPSRYVEKIKTAIESRLDCLIIDQGSFEWNGTGGVLEMAEATGAKGLLKWMAPKTAHRKFLNALLETPIHIILTLRGKPEITEGKDDRGQKTIIRGPIIAQQHDAFLYEMTCSFVLDREDASGNIIPGVPRIVKCPAILRPIFKDGEPLCEAHGAKLAEWVKGGAPVDHAFESLKAAGREAAEAGTPALQKWFVSLADADKKRIKPMLDTELKSAAKAADAMLALAETPEPAPPTTDPLPRTETK